MATLSCVAITTVTKLLLEAMEPLYKKYELLTNDSIEFNGHTLYRIRALKDFGDVKKGQLGGYIESRDNLYDFGTCWVYDNAKVFDKAVVTGHAKVYNNAVVYQSAIIRGSAKIKGNAIIYGNAILDEHCVICGQAHVYGFAKVSNSVCIGHNAHVYDNPQRVNYASL